MNHPFCICVFSFVLEGCQGIRHGVSGVGSYQDNQKQASILPAGAHREEATGAPEQQRQGWEILCRSVLQATQEQCCTHRLIDNQLYMLDDIRLHARIAYSLFWDIAMYVPVSVGSCYLSQMSVCPVILLCQCLLKPFDGVRTFLCAALVKKFGC